MTLSEDKKNKIREQVKYLFNRVYTHLDVKGLKEEIQFQKEHNHPLQTDDEDCRAEHEFYCNAWIEFLEQKIEEKTLNKKE